MLRVQEFGCLGFEGLQRTPQESERGFRRMRWHSRRRFIYKLLVLMLLQLLEAGTVCVLLCAYGEFSVLRFAFRGPCNADAAFLRFLQKAKRPAEFRELPPGCNEAFKGASQRELGSGPRKPP